MFGLSFSELAIAALVAFILFGPEQFPTMIKQAIGWMTKIKRFAYDAQNSLRDLSRDIEKEFNPIQENIAGTFQPKDWSGRNQAQGSANPSIETTLQPIQLDFHSDHYDQKVCWKDLIEVDRRAENYKDILKESS